ncbi:hypothetical protein Trydic_g18158 [Trypoxylus dichotomus]
MVVRHDIKGYEAFCKYIDGIKEKKENIYIFFSGSKEADGKSWCPDCVRAKPIIEKALIQADSDSVYVYVEVGDRTFWKDPNCPFRTDKRTKLLVLPTLVRWGQPQRLEGDQCEKEDLVEMLFTDE